MKIGKTKKRIYYWDAYVDNKRVRRESGKWKTQREVKAAYEEFLHSLNSGEIIDNPTFETIANEYIDSYSISRKRSSTRRIKSVIDSHLIPTFGKMRIKSIDIQDIQKFQKQLINTKPGKGNDYYSNDYLEAIQVRLRAVLTYAVQHSYIQKNPLELIPLALRNEYRPKKEYTILTNEQYEQFMEGITNPGHRIIFSLLYWCGLRSGELMALNKNDIDLINGELHIFKNYDTKSNIITTTKTNKDRYVDLPIKCIKDIEELFAYAASENIDGNFHLIGLNTIMSKSQMNRIKKQYIDLANKSYDIPYFTFHELRHTHVSTLLDLGLNAKDIADRLGHSVEMVNNTYGHLFPRRKKELMNKLNSL